MKKKFEKIKRQFNEFIQDIKLKILVLYLSIKNKNNTSKEYDRLTKIRKSNLQYSVKKVMIKKPLPPFKQTNPYELILKNKWEIKTDRFKEMVTYMDELRKPHAEAKLHGYVSNSSPMFYVPEIVEIHNESLADIKGSELSVLIKQENDLAYNSLERQKARLDSLQINKPTTLDVSRLEPNLEKSKQIIAKVDNNEILENFIKKLRETHQSLNE